MLTGRDLRGAAVSSASPHLRSEVIHASSDGRYLFLSLQIARDARPGKYLFRLTSAAGGAGFQFTLDPPLPDKGRFQGLTEDDVIYLLMPDRFANGDPSNDSPPEFRRPADRSSEQSYHGGDFRGVRQRLGYLKDLGITTIWMLPFYKNSSQHSSPAHGYHTVDFYAVEPRFGTIDELRELVDAAHRAGLKVMQDQVANHCGPYHPWVEAPPTLTWFHGLNVMPRLRNNFDIAALADPYAPPARRRIPLEGWFAGHLPDFNQDDPLIRDYMIQNALWWVGTTGIDGIRQDTYPYVDRAFWEEWQEAIDRQFPNLFVVGEITATTPAVLSFFEGGTRREGVDTRLDSMLDFPLYRAIRRVFGEQQPMAELVDVLAQDSLYRRPEWLVPFLGNHDEPRFLSVAGGDISRLLIAQAFLLTTRGIPHLYYGDEIAMGGDDGGTSRSVRADFPGGFPGDRIDAFTPEGRTGDSGTVFTALRRLIRFRAEHPALRRGKLVQLLVEKDRYAYLRLLAGGAVLILLNREGPGRPVTLNLTGLQLRDGLRLRSFDDASKEVAISDGKVSIQQPRAIEIYAASMNR
jgi:glycosidase